MHLLKGQRPQGRQSGHTSSVVILIRFHGLLLHFAARTAGFGATQTPDDIIPPLRLRCYRALTEQVASGRLVAICPLQKALHLSILGSIQGQFGKPLSLRSRVDSRMRPTVQKTYTNRVNSLVCSSCWSRLQQTPPCESGGTGRRARLRISWVTVGVQVPPLAPDHDQANDGSAARARLLTKKRAHISYENGSD